MLNAFSCGWQRSLHLLLHTLFSQRTQLVWCWLAVTQDVLLLHALASLNKQAADVCCFLFTVTHLPHFFIAVVSEVQVICRYDFIASVVVIIWICEESENI